jgi:hypothetical protein
MTIIIKLFILLSITITYTSCGGQKQTSIKPDVIKSQNKVSAESTSKNTSNVPTTMVRHVKQAINGDILIAALNLPQTKNNEIAIN